MLIHPSRSSARRQTRRHRPSLPPLYEVPGANSPHITATTPSAPQLQSTKSYTQTQRQAQGQEISIIVTTWDDEGKCWYPVEAHGPIERELRKHAERKRRERMARLLEVELERERT